MKRNSVTKIMPLVLAGALLVGCGKSTPTQQTSNAQEESLPSGEVSLRVWGAEEDEALVNQIIDSFVAEYGSEASFNITFEAHSESGVKDEVLNDVLNAPDVFTFADDQLRAMVAAGVLREVPNGSEIAGRNLDAASEAASINGTLYAYPLTADNGYFLYYNDEVIRPEDAETMDGLLAAASAAGQQVFMEMGSGWYMYSFFGGTDMEMGLGDDGISTYCNWNAKYTKITGADVASAMLAIGNNPAFVASDEEGFVAGAAAGKYAAGISGVWDENGIKEAWGEHYAAVKLPTYTVAGQQLQMSSYAGYKLIGVNSYSKNAAWAEVFADWMTNEQNQALRFEMRGQGPSNIAASNSGAVAESKALKALQQQATFASLQRVGGTYWDPASVFGNAMADGNPSGKDLQTLLNDMVYGITGEETTGDAEGAEEAAVEESEEAEATEEETVEEEAEVTEEEATEEDAEE